MPYGARTGEDELGGPQAGQHVLLGERLAEAHRHGLQHQVTRNWSEPFHAMAGSDAK